MTKDSDAPERAWPAALTDVTAGRIKKFREELKWTAADLAKEVTKAGLKYTRDQVVNLERASRRNTITVGEILVFAQVLGVPPILLIAPIGSDVSELEILPGEKMDPWSAARWIMGDDSEPVTLWREHDQYVASWSVISNVALGDSADEAAQKLAFYEAERRKVAKELRRLRENMRFKGLVPPELPPAIAVYVDDQTGERGDR